MNSNRTRKTDEKRVGRSKQDVSVSEKPHGDFIFQKQTVLFLQAVLFFVIYVGNTQL